MIGLRSGWAKYEDEIPLSLKLGLYWQLILTIGIGSFCVYYLIEGTHVKLILPVIALIIMSPVLHYANQVGHTRMNKWLKLFPVRSKTAVDLISKKLKESGLPFQQKMRSPIFKLIPSYYLEMFTLHEGKVKLLVQAHGSTTELAIGPIVEENEQEIENLKRMLDMGLPKLTRRGTGGS